MISSKVRSSGHWLHKSVVLFVYVCSCMRGSFQLDLVPSQEFTHLFAHERDSLVTVIRGGGTSWPHSAFWAGSFYPQPGSVNWMQETVENIFLFNLQLEEKKTKVFITPLTVNFSSASWTFWIWRRQVSPSALDRLFEELIFLPWRRWQRHGQFGPVEKAALTVRVALLLEPVFMINPIAWNEYWAVMQGSAGLYTFFSCICWSRGESPLLRAVCISEGWFLLLHLYIDLMISSVDLPP